MTPEIKFYKRTDPYGFLSNFWRSEQRVSDIGGTKTYKTNEHYYQSRKAARSDISIWIASAPKAWHAMKAGRNLRPEETTWDWDQIKVDVMLRGLRAKFQNESLRLMLLWTGDAILKEDSPTDMFWGGTLLGSQNMLGKLLMQVREEIKQGDQY